MIFYRYPEVFFKKNYLNIRKKNYLKRYFNRFIIQHLKKNLSNKYLIMILTLHPCISLYEINLCTKLQFGGKKLCPRGYKRNNNANHT